jgi:hypothetical protein
MREKNVSIWKEEKNNNDDVSSEQWLSIFQLKMRNIISKLHYDVIKTYFIFFNSYACHFADIISFHCWIPKKLTKTHKNLDWQKNSII